MSDKISFGNVFQSWFSGASTNTNSSSSNSTQSRVDGAFRKNATMGRDRKPQYVPPGAAPSLSEKEINLRVQSLNAAVDFLRARVKEGQELNFRTAGNRKLINQWLANPPVKFNQEPEATVITVCSYVNRLMGNNGCISMFDHEDFTAKEWLALNAKVSENENKLLHLPNQDREEIKRSPEFNEIVQELQMFVNRNPDQNHAINNFISLLHDKYLTAIQNKTYFERKETANYEAIRTSCPACFHGQMQGSLADLQNLPLNHSLVQLIIENADLIFDFSSLNKIPEKKETAEASSGSSSETQAAESSSPSDYKFDDEEEVGIKERCFHLFKTTLEESLKERPGQLGFRSGLLKLMKDDLATNSSSPDHENSLSSDDESEWGNFAPQFTPKPNTNLELPQTRVHQRMQVTSLRPSPAAENAEVDPTGPSIESFSLRSIQILCRLQTRIHDLEEQRQRFEQAKQQLESSPHSKDTEEVIRLKIAIEHMETTTLRQAYSEYKKEKEKLGAAAAQAIEDEKSKLINKYEADIMAAYLNSNGTASTSCNIDFELEALKSIAEQLGATLISPT